MPRRRPSAETPQLPAAQRGEAATQPDPDDTVERETRFLLLARKDLTEEVRQVRALEDPHAPDHQALADLRASAEKKLAETKRKLKSLLENRDPNRDLPSGYHMAEAIGFTYLYDLIF
ncbi:MAG: hypothetical protein OXG37_02955 [Actinomycetia bacterium]|nr:hypothetical protein [Actinomycetes bacterium]